METCGPGLCRIPDELLFQIIDALDDESACQLGLTCTDLHYRALPIVFKRHGTKDSNTGRISLYNIGSKHVLRALATALFIPDVDEIFLWPDMNSEYEYSYILAMTHLATRFTQVDFYFAGFEKWLVNIFLCHPGGRDARIWIKNLSAFLNGILGRGCTTLWVNSADDSFPDFPQTSYGLIPQAILQLTATRQLILPSRRGLAVGDILGTLCIFRTSGVRPDLASHTAEDRQKLSEFRVHSPVLLQRPFFPWIRSTLQTNATSITVLSLKTNREQRATFWKDILSSITLPSLYEFELTCHKGVKYWVPVDFTVLILFLSRHSSIKYLHLTAIYTPTPFSYPQHSLQPLLPQLIKLEAQPLFISWLLNVEAPFPRLQHLSLVTVISDFRHTLRDTEYDVVDEALLALANNNMTAHNIHLGLRFVPEFAVAQWMLRHVSQSIGTTQYSMSALRCVTKLSVYTTDRIRFHTDREVLNVVPIFLALFPCLKDVSFEHPGLEVLDPQMRQNVAEVCPRLERLAVNLK
jgi:hypothetical protein